MEKVIQAISTTKGIVYFTGVGKNMYTAARVSDTYQSLGIRSLFIDPVNSLHGGMGVFSPIDTVVAISKSGETEELIKFLTVLSRRDFENIIAISSSESSSLARLAKFSLIVPVRDEGDHLGLAPISSTMIYGAVLDSIAVEISSERGYSRLDFIENHPGGELGKTRG
jgi:arabinose-5-phosphate isomerase